MNDTNNNITIMMTGSALMGAGLVQLTANINTGLILIGVGALLQIIVAVLNKFGIPVKGVDSVLG